MVKETEIAELLGLDKFYVDEKNPHIVLNKEKCAQCQDRACLILCPAKLYTMNNQQISFDYAGCLECGTCRLVCQNQGIELWQYPKASFGINYRQG